MTPSLPLSLHSTVSWHQTPIAAEVDGDIVLMSIESGKYYGLDSIGSDIWRRVEAPIEIATLCAALEQTYDGDPVEIQGHVLDLLHQLHMAGLIEIVS